MVEAALTAEQQSFAAEHHGLVYSFLNEKSLKENDFYDIVVFGYLRAVKRYFAEPRLSQNYAFSTIAWGAMRTSLSNHLRSETRQKRAAITISIDTIISDDNEALPFQEALSVPDPLMLDLETELLMLDLASKVSKREMEIITMKTNGYGIREIAKARQMPVKGVSEVLTGVREAVLAVCY